MRFELSKPVQLASALSSFRLLGNAPLPLYGMYGLHSLPSSGRFLFSPKVPTGHGVASAELPTYTAPDALSQIEKLSGCSVVKLLRISSDDEEEGEDVVLHNSQLRVALAELLGIHHEQAKQGANMLHTIQQQYREVALLKEQISQNSDSRLAVNSEGDNQVQRVQQNRVTAYCEQATASSLALDQASVACKQLQIQLNSANEAHALEQQSLNNELRVLRDKGAALESKVSQLGERAAKAEQQLIFSQEQLATAQATAREEAAELQEKLVASEQLCQEKEEQTQIMREALESRKSRLETAEADLKHATEQLDELRNKVQWYEGRVQELEAAQRPSSTTACPAAATPPSDTDSPCALLKPPVAKSDSRRYAEGMHDGHDGYRNAFASQSQLFSSADMDLVARDTDAHRRAEEDDSDAQNTLNDLLVPSDSDTTPRGQNAERNVHSTSLHPLHANRSGTDRCRSACSTFSCEDEENTPVGTGMHRGPYDAQEESHLAHDRDELDLPLQTTAFAPSAVRVRDRKKPVASFIMDPYSPGSVPLGKSARAASARARPAGPATSFGIAPVPPMRRSEQFSSMRHASIPEDSTPVGFGFDPGLQSSPNSPPNLGHARTQSNSRTVEELQGAPAVSTSTELVPRAPLSSITNRETDPSLTDVLPDARYSGAHSSEYPFPGPGDTSAATKKHSAQTAHSNALVQTTPTALQCTHVHNAKEFQVSASVQDLAARLQEEHMRNEALLFALKQHRDAIAAPTIGPKDAGGQKRHFTSQEEASPSQNAQRTACSTADVGVQMVHSQVFAFDAIIQCRIAEDERAQNFNICSICGGTAEEALEGELTLAMGLAELKTPYGRQNPPALDHSRRGLQGKSMPNYEAARLELSEMVGDLKEIHESLRGSMGKIVSMHDQHACEPWSGDTMLKDTDTANMQPDHGDRHHGMGCVQIAKESVMAQGQQVDVEVASQGSSSSLGLSSMHLRMDEMDILLQEDSVLEALVAGLADNDGPSDG